MGGEWFARKDSNLEFQSQNLTCYHYTTGEQYRTAPSEPHYKSTFSRKVKGLMGKYFAYFKSLSPIPAGPEVPPDKSILEYDGHTIPIVALMTSSKIFFELLLT